MVDIDEYKWFNKYHNVKSKPKESLMFLQIYKHLRIYLTI